MTHHLNCLAEMVQMKGNNICFCAELKHIIEIITKYSLLSRALHKSFGLLALKCTGTPPGFTIIFTKGPSFCDLLSASLDNGGSPKRGQL